MMADTSPNAPESTLVRPNATGKAALWPVRFREAGGNLPL